MLKSKSGETPMKLNNLYPERTYQDLKRMMPYANKTYVQYDPKDKTSYRTIYFHFNVFSGKVQPMISNYIKGVPPSHLEPYSKALHSAVMRFNSLPDAPFH